MSPSPVRMADSDVDLMSKCLEFCQSLESQGRSFKLSIKLGNFSFSLDSKESTPMGSDNKKKLSPSQVKRNLRRKEEFLRRKSGSPEESSKEKTPENEAVLEVSSKCDLCDRTFSTEHGLNIHKGKSHGIKTLRSYAEASPLRKSPLKETSREEQCLCCNEVMSPHHQCETETLELNHSCQNCGKEFETKESLNKHICPALFAPLFAAFQSSMKSKTWLIMVTYRPNLAGGVYSVLNVYSYICNHVFSHAHLNKNQLLLLLSQPCCKSEL